MGKPGKCTTEMLAEYALGLRAESLPAETVETVQRCVLDLVGAAVAGASSEPAAIARTLAAWLGGAGHSDSWFGGGRRPAIFAAYANSAAASVLDLDDGHRAAAGHPGAAVIPAVLAVAQEVCAEWPEALAAVVAGYETGIRVSAARDFSALDTLATGRWCAYGVAAAAGRLRRFSVRQTAEAMAAAGVLSPGLSAAGYSRIMGNHSKEGIPWAVLTGLWAAEMAAGGFTGPLDILDHPGYYDPARIVAGLGQGFGIDGVYFKPYACCRWIHPALDGLVQLMAEQKLRAADICTLEVRTFSRALRLNNASNPDNLESAQYSMPFCLAVAALEGPGKLLPLESELLHRPDLVALADRIVMGVDPEFDRSFPEQTGARVVVSTADGRYESMCRHPRGDPCNPMDWNGLVEKFRKLSQPVLTEPRQARIIRAVEGIPNHGMGPLLDLLAQPLDRLAR